MEPKPSLQELFPGEELERRRHLFFIAMIADLIGEQGSRRLLTTLEERILQLCGDHLTIEAKLRSDSIKKYFDGINSGLPD